MSIDTAAAEVRLPDEGRTPTVDLRPVVSGLYAGRRMLVIGLALGLVAGGAAWALMGKTYEGVVTLAVNQSRDDSTTPVSPANFRALLENYSVATEAIKTAQLDQGAHAITPREFISDALTVEEVRGTQLLRIRLRLYDPVLAAAVANDVARLAVALSRKVNQEEGSSLRDQLSTQQTEAEARLRQAESALVAFQRASQIDVLKADIAAMLKQRERLQQVESQLAAERAGEAAAGREQAARAPVLTLNKTIASDPSLAELARDQRPPSTSILGLGLKSEESNSVYQTIDANLALSRTNVARLDEERQHILETSAVMARGGKLAELYSLEIEEARLKADLALARKVYEDVALRHEQARVVVTSGSAQLQVVDAAVPSAEPVSWPIAVWLTLGAITGLVIASASSVMAVLAGMLRRSVANSSSV